MSVVRVGFREKKLLFEVPVAKKLAAAQTEDPLDERLLSAAVEVFLEKGFAAASVDEIAARAKASKLTFYNHYGNKEALFEAVVRRQNRTLIESLAVAIPDGMALRDFLEAMAHRIHESLLRSDAVKLVRVLHAEAGRFPKLATVFDEAGPSRAMKLLAAAMEKHMERGDLCPTDPALAAEHFLHLSIGELMRRYLLGLRPVLTKSEVSRRIAAGIEVFIRAYGRAKP